MLEPIANLSFAPGGSGWAILLRLAGAVSLAIAIGSLAIPAILQWRAQLRGNRALIRQVFWTYAGYIFTAHICFGVLSLAAPQWILGGGPLGRAVCGFIAAWWGARVVLQFAYFDRADAPQAPLAKAGEFALVAAFAVLAATYGAAAVIAF